jgi:hypothetical protein
MPHCSAVSSLVKSSIAKGAQRCLFNLAHHCHIQREPAPIIIAVEGRISGLRHSPQCPTLPVNLGEHTCYLYTFAPIPSTESNSGILFPIASIAAPSHQMRSVCWGCLHRLCPNSDFPWIAICAPQRDSKQTTGVYKRTKVTLKSGMFDGQ